MIIKRSCFILWFLYFTILVYAQNENIQVITPHKNAVFLEIGGAAGAYSINYDRIILIKDHLKLSFRVGYAIFRGPSITPLFATPVLANLLLGRSKGHLEISVGVTLFNGYNVVYPLADNLSGNSFFNPFELYSTFFIGYRYQKPSGGFFFRAGYAPLLNSNRYLTPIVGVGGGWTY